MEVFLKEWLRHAGRTQADLRRALRAGSIRMPVLLYELQRTVSQAGIPGLAERLCSIEAQWLGADPATADDSLSAADELAQLDLLLQEIRSDSV
ncbi:MAG: hypothetical protein EBU30_07770 [Synechococcaceae bacterium WB6_3B_236]|nr:hypothetical protein [Synechococcaceae bacterium WB6_3B_236]